jgi:hypothetical protein
MKTFQMMFMAGALVLGGATVTKPASASGFLGGLIEGACGGCGVGRALDRANAQSGHIFEHGVAALSNYFIPGSGVVLEGVWTAQDIRNAYEQGDLSEEDATVALVQLGEDFAE